MIGNAIAGFLGTGVAVSASSYESIATTTVGAGGSATVTFNSIPGTYKHLQLRAHYYRSTAANAVIYFNADTTSSNYRSHYTEADGASVSAGTVTTYGGIYSFVNKVQWGAAVIDILDYGNTGKTKTVRILSGVDNNGTGMLDFNSGLWNTTNNITSVSCSAIGGNFAQYTSFALYGIKG
ncbi:hypothetical protein UFOVP974_16 [uncultured Caudovirales phage]|uniref:Uncharacterized protein n=1 Tax=uncultured Caudovirales phage TaxID=2100421 RepID=A0A6J5T5P6_9CAUD|nr:hypothetical protein UFOVP974_16 [uncultured Caudovirales phage]CAB4194026.1 hypothetical protein UFOVP1256_4 [uncultured Caudovirales phage]CAB4222174.1 hypothetical protein UFOVP1643_26 [uncultured Caudovirales phage]